MRNGNPETRTADSVSCPVGPGVGVVPTPGPLPARWSGEQLVKRKEYTLQGTQIQVKIPALPLTQKGGGGVWSKCHRHSQDLFPGI